MEQENAYIREMSKSFNCLLSLIDIDLYKTQTEDLTPSLFQSKTDIELEEEQRARVILTFLTLLTILGSCLNPILYAYTSK